MFLYWVAMGYPVITCVELSKNCAIVPKMPCAVWQNIILKVWVFRQYCLHVQIAFLQRFVRLQEAFSVGMLVTIAVSVFLSTLKLLTSSHTVRSWLTLKVVIERFWKGSVHELKENVKVEPKNSKETSENNTDIEMDLLILREYFRMFFKRAQVFTHMKQRFTVSWWISILYMPCPTY